MMTVIGDRFHQGFLKRRGAGLLAGLFAGSLLTLGACAEQPGKKKEEKPVEEIKQNVNKTKAAADETKTEEKKPE